MVRLIPAVLVALALPGINAGPCKVPTTTTTSTSATTTPSTAPSCTAYAAAPYGAVCGGEGPPPGNPPTIATLNLPTPEECAYACYQTACSKFGFTTGNCILYGERQEQRLVRVARTVCPPYYDLACFDCSGTSTSTAPGSTTTTPGSTPTTTPENSATSPTTTPENSATSPTTTPGNTPTTKPENSTTSPTTTPEYSATSPTTTPENTPTTTPENSATSPTTTPENSTTSPTTTSENSATAPTTTPESTPTTTPKNSTTSPTTTPENSTTSPTTTSENSATAPTTTPESTPTTTPKNSTTSPTTTPENTPTSPTTTSENSTTSPTTTPESTPTTTPKNSTTSPTTTTESSATSPTTTPEETPTTTPENSATSPTTTTTTTTAESTTTTTTTTTESTTITTESTTTTTESTTTTTDSTTTTSSTTSTTTTAAPTCDAYDLVPSPPSGAKCGFEGAVNIEKSPIATASKQNKSDCAKFCVDTVGCESFSYNSKSDTCSLFDCSVAVVAHPKSSCGDYFYDKTCYGCSTTTTTTTSTTTTSSTTSTTTTAAPTCDAYQLAPSAPSNAKCGFEGGVKSGKHAIATATKQKQSDCAKFCADNADCESFSYNSKTDICSLFDCSVTAVAYAKSSCGDYFYDNTCYQCTPPAPPTCDAYQLLTSTPANAMCGFEGGVKSAKHPITTAIKQKQSDCAKFCADQEGCESFSYNSKTDVCSLFDCSVTTVAYAKSSCGDFFYDKACYGCQSTTTPPATPPTTPPTTPPAVCQLKTTGLSGAVCGREGTKKNSVNYIDMKSASTRAQCAQFCFNNAACDSWAYRIIGSVCTLYDRGVSSASSSNGGCGVEWYDRECYSCPTTTTTPPATCSSYSLISKPSSNQICNKKGEICKETFLSFGDATSDATCAKSCNQTQGCKLFSRANNNGVYKCSMYSAYDFTANIYGAAFSQPDCYECCDSSNSGTSIRRT